MPLILTDSAIAKAFREARENKRRGELADAREPGLRVRLTPGSSRNPTGSQAWVLCCRDRAGAMRRFAIGTYDGDDGMSIAEARTAARALRLRVREGHDPIAQARNDRAIGRDARAGIGTLTAGLDLYGETRSLDKNAKMKSWAHSRKRVDRVFAALLDRPLDHLTAEDFQTQANIYPKPQSAAFAVRTVRPVLKWLAGRKRAPAGLAALYPPAAVSKRQRALSREELGRVLPELRAAKTTHATMMRFLLLTMARLNEAGTAPWGSIDWRRKTWTIPATTAKNAQAHVVDLSHQALELLHSLKPADAQPGDLIFASATGSPLGNWDRASKAVQKASETANWHRHDLRRTATSLLGELSIRPHVLEAALNHQAVGPLLNRVYNLSRYRPEVKQALQLLADHLDRIEAGDDPDGSDCGRDGTPDNPRKRPPISAAGVSLET